MDKNKIAILKDQSIKIEQSFAKIDKNIKSYNNANKNRQKLIKKENQNELGYIKEYLIEMNNQIQNLQIEENIENWNKIYDKYKSKKDDFKEKIKNLDSKEINIEEKKDDDFMDVNAKVDYNKLNVEQVEKRGDKFVEENGKAIGNMIKLGNENVDNMKDANQELNNQIEKLEGINQNLKEIDFSVGRARQKITNMFKIYASDKLIICLIVVILIIIVTIILVSAFGGDNKNNFNLPHDVFGSNDNKTITSNYGLSIVSSFNLLKIILYFLFLIEI